MESAHAAAYLAKFVKKTKKTDVIIMCLSGRGDKDIDIMRKYEQDIFKI
jgi:tryptophan synthase beta chain